MKFVTVEIELEWQPICFGLIYSQRQLHLLLFGLHVRLEFNFKRKGP